MDPNITLTYFVLRDKSDNPADDFPQFVFQLKNQTRLDIIQETPSLISLSNHLGYKSHLEYLPSPEAQFAEFPFCAKLTISKEDYLTFESIKRFCFTSRDQEFKIFSQNRQAFIPKSLDLLDLEFGNYNLETLTTLRKYSLEPLYFSQEFRTYYALSPDQKIHIVNPFLLSYIYKKEIPETELEELSYPVAPSLQYFAGMYSKGLVPLKFYEYYHRSTKVINASGFNINQPGRKVFIKPYIFEFNNTKGNFYTYIDNSGGSVIYMDKIRPGETLEQSLNRILQIDLKLASDYLGAFVSEQVEFDRDRDGVLTPRLIVFVYVDQISDKAKALQLSQTGWKSLGQNLPRINPNPHFLPQSAKDTEI
jgi:hypothetical protein